ncbi:hypothetical protein FHS18_002143 [Paenibacillus phyllosphaerae]|uniref:YhfM-like domain-containing protein n=1 Tax=Paenibacillus phyllosphaerae TaxID=274593 RepID=A0A7W5AXQ3_9BACL|nr:hypothetical protein [Paenibacillus phyllosphaerae]MBB3110076.1 hypothetical protein [Paenibacillus phyllosphaerae]
MKLRSRFILITGLSVIVVLAAVAYFALRIPYDQVVIVRMAKFGEAIPDSERVIHDQASVQAFTYAVRYADKQPGQVDIADPNYRFTLGKKDYYLWVSEQYRTGTLMKLPDSGTIYRIGESRARELLKIIQQAMGGAE